MDVKCYPQDEERNQCRLEPYQQFPCTNTAPSTTIPNSVHRLRPGDIKVAGRCFWDVLTLACFQVVAALGDSITAGVGARANSVLDIFTEYRYSHTVLMYFHPLDLNKIIGVY